MTASYPQTEVWKTFETDEVVCGGGATFAADAELAQVVVTLYKHGAGIAAGVSMRARLYHDFALTKLYASGAWTSLDFGGAACWRGTVPLNFDDGARPFVEAGQTYYVAIEMTGYARNGNDAFIGLAYDWPLPINDNASALAMAFIVRQGVRY